MYTQKDLDSSETLIVMKLDIFQSIIKKFFIIRSRFYRIEVYFMNKLKHLLPNFVLKFMHMTLVA